MKIGLITMNEKYWSLQKMSENVLRCMRLRYEVDAYKLQENKEKNKVGIDALYRNNDTVIYLASRLLSFENQSGKPTLFFTHAWMDHGAGINFYAKNKVFSSKDILIFTSSSARNKFWQVYETNLQTAVVPYFTMQKKTRSDKSTECYTREKYQLSDKDVILYFGRFSPEKNIEVLFETAMRLENKNFMILLIGDFTEEHTYGFGTVDKENYRKKIKELMAHEKTGRIKIIKKVAEEDLYQIIKIAYLVINPSLCLEEDFGLSMVEALSLGAPVVASEWGGIKDIIRNGQDGFLVKTSFRKKCTVGLDKDQMVNIIDNLLSNREYRDRLSRNAMERYREKFSKCAFLENMRVLLDGIGQPQRKNSLILRPKEEYRLVYESSLRNKSVSSIYLNNPRLFKNLYACYLSDQK